MSEKTGPDRINAACDTAMMSRLRLALERELHSDEKVLWHGWQLGRLELYSFGLYLFAVPWTAFSVLWTAVAAGAIASMDGGGPGLIGWAFPLFGLPFIAIGVAMLAKPFVPLIQKGRVLYVVTDHRVLKLAMGRELKVETVPASRIGLIIRHEKRDGTGRLQLAVKIGKDSDGDNKTEYFELGTVADVMGAHEALNRIAAPVPPPSAASGQIMPLRS